MSGLLEALREAGCLAPIDVELARALAELEREPSGRSRSGQDAIDAVAALAALASRALRNGDTCLRLDQVADAPLPLDDESARGVRPSARAVAPTPPAPATPATIILPPLATLRRSLEGSAVVGAGEGTTPLVLDRAGRLYLRRMWEHERALAAALRSRALREPAPFDEAHARAALDRLFPPARRGDEPDLQRVAAAAALSSLLCVVAGGPGTGKTSTVARLLALLLELHARAATGERARPLRILLLAPTGKAAARLVESIARAREGLACDDAIRAAIPGEAATLHRALGLAHDGEHAFRHHAGNPLAADVVVVDETSMVDLALMRRLVDAVPAGARLVLLGDPGQLASVEAGAVLGELCGESSASRFHAARADRLARVSGVALGRAYRDEAGAAIDDAVVKLARSYRFDGGGAISSLSRAIRDGDAEAALAQIGPGASDLFAADARLHPFAPGAALGGPLLDEVVAGYEGALAERDPARALAALSRFRVLCAHRHGPFGAATLNRLIELALAERGLLRGPSHAGAHYAGRPVLVTRNDYSTKLWNGDVGLILDGPHGLRAVFAAAEGPPRALAPARLPPHETVFAMTVHKSQGSEFDRVALVLPDATSPLLTRELLYTAVTRARLAVSIHGAAASVRAAVERKVVRASGLSDALRAET